MLGCCYQLSLWPPSASGNNDGISVIIWSISVGPIQLILPPPVPQEFLGGKCYFVSGLAFCHCLDKCFKFTVSPICINFSSSFISLLTCSRKYMILLKQKVNLGMFLLLCSHECCSFVCLPSLLFPLQQGGWCHSNFCLCRMTKFSVRLCTGKEILALHSGTLQCKCSLITASSHSSLPNF